MDIGVLTIVVFAMVFPSAYHTMKWRTCEDDSFTSTYKLYSIVLIVITLGLGSVEGYHHAVQYKLTEYNRTLTGDSNKHVHCQRMGETFIDALPGAAGFVSYDDLDKMTLKFDTCKNLVSYLFSNKSDPNLRQIHAVHIFNHETIHQMGEFSESRAECFAMQSNAKTAMVFGASKEEADGLQQRYYDEIYPYMPGQYQTGKCSPDEELDLTPGDGIFP